MSHTGSTIFDLVEMVVAAEKSIAAREYAGICGACKQVARVDERGICEACHKTEWLACIQDEVLREAGQ